jgi:hypothetical protein
VCVYFVSMLFCMWVVAMGRAKYSVEGVLQTVNRITKLKSGQGTTKGCRAVDRWLAGCSTFDLL